MVLAMSARAMAEVIASGEISSEELVATSPPPPSAQERVPTGFRSTFRPPVDPSMNTSVWLRCASSSSTAVAARHPRTSDIEAPRNAGSLMRTPGRLGQRSHPFIPCGSRRVRPPSPRAQRLSALSW